MFGKTKTSFVDCKTMEKPSHERRLTALCQRIPKLRRSTFSRRRLLTTADFSWDYPLVMADSSLLKMVQSK
jgi:hypothetical protein